jgi:GNAT superfamily N-acetyltransferase
VGFALCEQLGAHAHLQELDVHPEHGRRGIGAALVGSVCDWARASGHASVILTTYREIPWNETFYRRLGFEELPPARWDAALRAQVAEEAEAGLDPAARLAMRLRLGPVSAG